MRALFFENQTVLRRDFMLRGLARAFITLVGVSIGYTLGVLFQSIEPISQLLPNVGSGAATTMIINISFAIILGIIFYLSSSWIVKKSLRVAERTEKELSTIPFNQMLSGSIGLIIGLLISFLINPLFRNLIGDNVIYTVLSVVIYALLGYLGIRLGTRYLSDPNKIREQLKLSLKPGAHSASSAMPKVLDTSVIIDGRIADLCKTGFIEGKIIIAEFVLEELRHIADSADDIKRVRGRRGLDILNIIQKELDLEVVVTDEDFEDVQEVDVKLLKLAQKHHGAIVTNDFNLNKVAGIQGVKVLNINELTNAVKSVVLPGETMIINILKPGKEQNQGVAYLDDGTMIVVEDGKKMIGKETQVVVTSVLQTAAGRMIFARVNA